MNAMMNSLMDEEARAALIDEATRDWLGSQVFPEIPMISEGSNLRLLGEFVSPAKQPVILAAAIQAATTIPAIA